MSAVTSITLNGESLEGAGLYPEAAAPGQAAYEVEHGLDKNVMSGLFRT